jgi:hypothetical protein
MTRVDQPLEGTVSPGGSDQEPSALARARSVARRAVETALEIRRRMRGWSDLILFVGIIVALLLIGRIRTFDLPTRSETASPPISAPVRGAEAMVPVTPEVVEGLVESNVVLVVRVSGRSARPVVDRVVRWSVESDDGGELESRAVRTDPQGLAQTTVRLPPQPGRLVVVARAEGDDLPEVRFDVTVLSGAGDSETGEE